MYMIDANRKVSPYARGTTITIPFNYQVPSKGLDLQPLNLNSSDFKPKSDYPRTLSAIQPSRFAPSSKMVAFNSKVETYESALFTGTQSSHHSLATTILTG
jgi:hypothetical protein